ncbi:hypothetical protein CW740_00745 [Kangiella profundi]|uniref:DUF4123 domain-containing protein n=1 Tax=Kangiella profundi TaxID=1561924 RepID=A0A2K9AVB9_9GAMM|nr:DUF4123 domain-containing protein [Kangiella profundi]AUD77839.1 hypothetical protein CW740_00745 [Kangiella profundi]GGE92085.1 hypothetical protein GCM10011356_02770 [Kangiella profundi]
MLSKQIVCKHSLSRAGLKEQLEKASLGIKNYAIIDAAKNETLFSYIKGRKDSYTSLFVKDSRQELKTVAPYLLELEAEDANWIIDDIIDKDLGFVIGSETCHQDWVNKLSEWIYQKDEKGKVSLFRHYDPVVLRQLIENEGSGSDSIVTEIYPDSVIVMKASNEKYTKWTIGSKE